MRPAIRAICQEVAEHYGFSSADDILVKDRHKSVCEARHVAVWLARRKYGLSYPELGREFGLDHTTCRNSVQRVEAAGGLLRDSAQRLEVDLVARSAAYAPSSSARLN